jgi:hypothetical protein
VFYLEYYFAQKNIVYISSRISFLLALALAHLALS